MRERVRELLREAGEWARGRSAAPRAVLLAYLAWAALRHLASAEYADLFSGLTFGIHELGHLVFAPLGHFLSVLGGSFWQVAAPAAAVFLFLRQPDFFGAAVGLCWLSSSLFDLARYVGDARSMSLPLVGLVPDPEHDWNVLLGALGLLPLDHAIAFATRVLGGACAAAGIAFGVFLLRRMGATER